MMDNYELNEKLAVVLETKPIMPGYRTIATLSFAGMWRCDGNGGAWWPVDFCRDGNAMISLIQAMQVRGYSFGFGAGHCVFESTAGIGRELLPANWPNLPLAVARAAADALGIDDTKPE